MDKIGSSQSFKPSFYSEYGHMFQGDCLEILPTLPSESVDLVFADPPFNLKKQYPSKINDDLKATEYLSWCEKWLSECIRVLKFGGSLFVWNIPRWNTYISGFLNQRMTFRHWISVDIKYSLPINGRLYPSHYSLLYYCKGAKPKVFHPDRLPMETCPKCAFDLHDYGGYKDKMNPKGINLSDVWYDIPPVRHSKYKKRQGANELSIKLLDRIIEMASNEDDVVLDPFGGAGTTYIVAEIKKRQWIGCEIGPIEVIEERFKKISEDRELLTKIRKKCNVLFTDESYRTRKKNGFWTCESVRERKKAEIEAQEKQLALL
ncbi:MAG: site-specific DNA-methyltransferase [Candidatus Wallbacteria bacterium]|nr:site-specific DNA-methyltransferase [Candidatus Wallbacteria bacterium]